MSEISSNGETSRRSTRNGPAAAPPSDIAATARLAMQEVVLMGDNYLHTLLKNIKFMLRYVNETGIQLPDDLRNKLARLLTHPELAENGSADAAPAAGSDVGENAGPGPAERVPPSVGAAQTSAPEGQP